MSGRDPLDFLRSERERVHRGGGEAAQAKQHARGKLTARERIALLLDPGTFEESGTFVRHRGRDFGLDRKELPGDAVVTGAGLVDGREVFVFSQDFTVMGGTLAESHAQKICRLMDRALKAGRPIIGLKDSGGARIQEGVDSMGGYADIFLRNTLASGVVPQLSLILGPCAGGAVYSPAITDFILMAAKTAYMFITGPDVVRAVTYESVSSDDLGGPGVHAERSGVSHLTARDDAAALLLARRLLGYLPSNFEERPPVLRCDDDPCRELDGLEDLVPAVREGRYDVRQVLEEVFDRGSLLELMGAYAPSAVTALGRLDGHPVGIVASQPTMLEGVLDLDAAMKIARFVRTCDAFNVPLITFVDCPGVRCGVEQEQGGLLRHLAKMIYAYAEATVPRQVVVLRRAYGAGVALMDNRALGADLVLAWPGAELAVTSPGAIVRTLHREELENCVSEEARRERATRLREAYLHAEADVFQAAARGIVDAVIDPRETRWRLVEGLRLLQDKSVPVPRRKHGSVPL